MSGKDEQWPNTFIVGAEKSGTTSLYSYLRDTPGVFASSEKGPRYFHKHNVDVYLGNPETRISDRSKYLKLFQKRKDEKIVVEASASYLRDPETPKMIHDSVPHAKIIIMLRNPVERAFSSYLMRRTSGQEKRPLHRVISDGTAVGGRRDREYNLSLDAGLYSEQVKRYIDTFGSKQVGIWIFEEFVENPAKTVKDILEFLGIDSVPPESVKNAYNPYGRPRGRLERLIIRNRRVRKMSRKIIPQDIRWSLRQNLLLKRDKKPDLTSRDRRILEDFYRGDIKKLEGLLMRRLPWHEDTARSGTKDSPG